MKITKGLIAATALIVLAVPTLSGGAFAVLSPLQGSWLQQNGQNQAEIALDATQQAGSLASKMTNQWWNSLGNGEWLHISSVYEMGQSDLGIDSETGWPNPQTAKWDIWFKLDEQGFQTVYLARRTDLERENVTYAAWTNGTLLRLPSGVRENTAELGNAWDAFSPLNDHYCNTRFEGLNQEEEGISYDISIIEDGGLDQIEMNLLIKHPPISEVSGFEGIFVGTELTCYRIASSGAIVSGEEYLIREDGERILSWREYNQDVEWVNELPDDVLKLYQALTFE